MIRLTQIQLLEQVFEQLGLGLVIMNRDMSFSAYNKEAKKLTAAPVPGVFTPEEWKPSYGLFHPNGDRVLPEEMQHTKVFTTGGLPKDRLYQVVNPNSPPGGFWMEVKFTRLTDNGTTIGLICMSRDVTAEKQREQQLLHSNEDLRQFAYAASHDLQEPMRKVEGFVELLREALEANQMQSVPLYLDILSSAASRQRQLIDDLLSLSRVEKQGDLEPTSLKAALTDTMEELSALITMSQAQVSFELKEDCVLASPWQIRLIFRNLLSNAIKFHKQGEPPVVHVSSVLTPGQGQVQVQVSDQGIGFDMKHKDRIFRAFERLHSKSAYPGTGVGLATVKRVIEKHHGALRVVAAPDKGATFTFTLPAGEFLD